MQHDTSSTYFQALMTALLNTEITNRHGITLTLDAGTQEAIQLILQAGESGKIMVIGNGGSAAIASHVHNDLCKAVGVKALVFTESPLLTALTNDLSYADAYEKQLELWATEGDLLIAISSSGKSENILRAVHTATQRHCTIITLSGFSANNPLRQKGNLNFYVPSNAYGFVEMGHAALLHFLTDAGTMQRQAKVKTMTSTG